MEPENELPSVLHTERLVLRLADPSNPADCDKIISTYTDSRSGSGGHGKVALNTMADVQRKHELHGPKAQFCTLVPPPRGMYFLIHLRDNENDEHEPKGPFIGIAAISFRAEMPYPDLGWALFGQYQGHGYATEAGREALRFWHDLVGVKEICAVTMEDNVKSQKCAERIGFVKAGTLEIVFGEAPNESWAKGRAMTLPGMKWQDGLTLRPTIGMED